MRITKLNKGLIFTFIMLICTLLMAEPEGGKKAPLGRLDTGTFTGNKIHNDLENNGMVVSARVTGHSGMEWPAGEHKYSNYASGVWFAGKVGDAIRTAVGEYGPEFVSGPWDGDSDADEHQLYIVSKSDLADPLANSDFQNWPAHLGAPWVDNDGDGVYSPLPNGLDHPEFIGDQVIWYIMNDGDASAHSIFGTQPLDIEVRVTIWGYNRPDAFGDMMFVKAQAFNKGTNEIKDMYVGLWDDPDLGNAGDDFVGCDTTLSLGYCYNDGPDNDYGAAAPAIGYDFFQASVPGAVTDTAFAFGATQAGFKKLEMSSFTKYINGDDVYTDPADEIETYNYMSGFKKDGTAFVDSDTGLDSKFVHPCDPNGNTGDNDGCWVDSDDHASGDRRFLMNVGPFNFSSGDSLELVFGIMHAQGADPLNSITLLKEVDKLAQLAYDIQFALPDSPSQPEVSKTASTSEIILSWNSVAELYTAVDKLDLLPALADTANWDTTWTTQVEFARYDSTWWESFDSTTVTGSSVNHTYDALSDTAFAIDTVWIDITASEYAFATDNDVANDTLFLYDTADIRYIQVVDNIVQLYAGQETTFKFEGYNVWQHENASGTGNRKLIATYDLSNGVKEIMDDVFDASYGSSVNIAVQAGTDSGIKRWINITKDYLNGGTPLINGRKYYYTVNSYGYNPYGIPKTLESADNIFSIRPQKSVVNTPAVDVEYSDFTSTHTAGAADGSISVSVINPYEVTGDDYEVFFEMDTSNSFLVWGVNNTTQGTVPVTYQPVQSGVDASDGSEAGTYSSPVFDGLQVAVSGPPYEFKDFYATQNANGPIDGYAGAAADYYGYPGMGRENIESQQSNGSTWFITTSNGSNKEYEDFYPYVTRYTAGYGNPNGGIQHLIPDDFEFRFTEAGGKMWDDENGVFIDVSMEVWNIGDVLDPADDYQMLPMYWDDDGNGIWDLAADDHPISSASNDPYMESFYVLEHHLQEPGTSGYEAMIAALTADPSSNSATGGYIWASSPGYLGAAGQITSVVFLNMTFANWNGGDVEDATFPANVDAASPEIGTVFRIVTTKPNTANDKFAFSTSTAAPASIDYSCENIFVWPNPYFGYNPEERTAVDNQIHFGGLSAAATIKIYDLNGNLVKKIEHSTSDTEIWDVKNNFGIVVASGIYIANIEADGCETVLKIAIIAPEQRIDVY